MADKDRKTLSTGKNSSGQEIAQFLRQVKQLPAQNQNQGRLLFAIDATASRQHTWDTATHLQASLFQATDNIGGLLAQLCYYRGFSEFVATPWYNSAAKLKAAMQPVNCLGGHTQIERLLRHVLKQTKESSINAVVFIGDAVEENADTLCHLAGQLALYNTPLFLFHEGHDHQVKSVFQQMAQLSGGAYCPFDSNSAAALADLLGAVATYASGGANALIKLSTRNSAAKHLAAQLKLEKKP